jgi:hypothetical protein
MASKIGLSCFLHHIHEFLKIDFTVSIGVNFHHGTMDSFFGDQSLKFISLKKCDNFFVVNFSTAVLIKHLECSFKVIVSHKDVGVDRGSDEFCIINLPRVICVSSLKHIIQIFTTFFLT